MCFHRRPVFRCQFILQRASVQKLLRSDAFEASPLPRLPHRPPLPPRHRSSLWRPPPGQSCIGLVCSGRAASCVE
eukprot:9015615-Alexandrium_andersonii.AAC.1